MRWISYLGDNIFKTSSTRYTISTLGDGTDAEPMDERLPKVTGTDK